MLNVEILFLLALELKVLLSEIFKLCPLAYEMLVGLGYRIHIQIDEECLPFLKTGLHFKLDCSFDHKLIDIIFNMFLLQTLEPVSVMSFI